MLDCEESQDVGKFNPVELELPGWTDNTGLKSLESTLLPGKSITESLSVNWTATDYHDNVATCTITVNVIGRFQSVAVLTNFCDFMIFVRFSAIEPLRK